MHEAKPLDTLQAPAQAGEISRAQRIEASNLAAAILMPAKILREAAASGRIDVDEMARTLLVTGKALSLRLQDLRLQGHAPDAQHLFAAVDVPAPAP